MTIKLLTLNTHSWYEENFEEKFAELIKALLVHDFDIICFQEINQKLESTILQEKPRIRSTNFALLVTNALNAAHKNERYTFTYEPFKISYESHEEGLAILTRHKTLETESFYITPEHQKHSWKERKGLVSTIEVKGIPLRIVNVHTGHYGDLEFSFFKQLKEIKSTFDDFEHVFICGDFNTEEDSKGYPQILDMLMVHDMHTLCKNPTKDTQIYTVDALIAGWDTHHKKRIDYIFSKQAYNVQTSQLIFDNNNFKQISDHFGYYVEFELTTENSLSSPS